MELYKNLQKNCEDKELNYLEIADFLVNGLDHYSLGDAIVYLEEEFRISEENSIKLITDYLRRYSINTIIPKLEISEFIKAHLFE